MTLIRKKTELEVPQRIKALIFGQAGSGKTTLALSAPKPLLLDFDGGVHRVNYEHQPDATVQIGSWSEAIEVLNEDLSPFETIIIDTVGKMLDYIVDDAEKKRIGGWKKWEHVNDNFRSFIRSIHAMNKHVILVAHRDTRKEGDETVFIPAIREKNYTSVVTELDLLGYLEMRGVARVITFNPTSRNDGKNTCNLPESISVPMVVDKAGKASSNTFFVTQIINPYNANLQKRAESIKAYEAVISEIKENISQITDEVSANDFCKRIDKFSHTGNSKAAAGKLLLEKVNELGLKLNKDTKLYERAT